MRRPVPGLVLLAFGLAGVGGCLAPERVGVDANQASLLISDRLSGRRTYAISEPENLALVPDAEIFRLGYEVSLEELGLELGLVPSPEAEDCGARGLGHPPQVARLEREPELRFVEAALQDVPTVELPSLDLEACAARQGCLEVVDGFAVCKLSCISESASIAAPMAPSRAEPPSFCEADACPQARRVCASGSALPGLEECVDLGPCGAGDFRDRDPIGLGPMWVVATAAPGGDGTVGSPLATIDEAFRSGATDIFVGPGSYDVRFVIDRDLRIYGSCPSRTTITGPSDLGPDAELRIEGATIIGIDDGPLVIHRGGRFFGSELVFRNIGLSLSSEQGGQVDLERSVLSGFTEAIYGSRSRVDVRGSDFDTSLVSANLGAIVVSSSTLTVDGTRFSGAGLGRAIAMYAGSRGSVRRSVFLEGPGTPLQVARSELDASDLYFDGEGRQGRADERGAIFVSSKATVTLERVMIRSSVDSAIFASDASLFATDVITIGTTSARTDELDRGALRARGTPELKVERWRSQDDQQTLNIVEPLSPVNVSDLEVLGDGGGTVSAILAYGGLLLSRARIGPRAGVGIRLQRQADVKTEDLVIEGATYGVVAELDAVSSNFSTLRAEITANTGLRLSGDFIDLSDVVVRGTSAGLGIGSILGDRAPSIRHFDLSASVGSALVAEERFAPPLQLEDGRIHGPLSRGDLGCAPTWGWTVRDVVLVP